MSNADGRKFLILLIFFALALIVLKADLPDSFRTKYLSGPISITTFRTGVLVIMLGILFLIEKLGTA